MHSEKFRINTNGQSLRNPTNGFFGMTLSANNLNSDESDLAANNDRRSAHNALERQRREHLNVKFQQLAHVLPSLQSIRRPSKTMIVAKSLEYVTSSLKRENNFTSEIQKLKEENAKLKSQVESSNSKLKNQIRQVTVKKEDETPKPSLKRKASTDLQLSPPPTPEAIPKKNVTPKKQAIVVARPQKKKMVKQTKVIMENVPLIPWSPIDSINASQSQHNTPTTIAATTTSSAPAICYNMTSPYPDNSAQNDNLAYVSPHPMESFSYLNPQNTSFMPEMNPMLLAPYYIPSESGFPFTPYPNQTPSNDSSFYL